MMTQFNLVAIGGVVTLAASAALMSGVSTGHVLTPERGAIITPTGQHATLAALQDPEEQCVYSQGFWKNNPDAWPVDELMLGEVLYTQDELLDILNQPPRGNGLVILAKQLIAAKLNVADDANTPDEIHEAIDDADDLIGDLVVPPVGDGSLHPSMTGELNTMLATYNDGELHDEDCELIGDDDPDE